MSIIKKINLKVFFILLCGLIVAMGLGLYCFSQATAEETDMDNLPTNETRNVFITTADDSLFSWTDSVTKESGSSTSLLSLGFTNINDVSHDFSKDNKYLYIYDTNGGGDPVQHNVQISMDNGNYIYDIFEDPFTQGIKNFTIEHGQKTKITFDPNGGTFPDGSDKPIEIETYFGFNLSKLALPIPSYGEKSFIGWFTEKEGGDCLNSDAIVNEALANSTVYAHYGVPGKAKDFKVICNDSNINYELYKYWNSRTEKICIKKGMLKQGEEFALDKEYLPQLNQISKAYLINADIAGQYEVCKGSSQVHIVFYVEDTMEEYALILEADFDSMKMINGASLNGKDLEFVTSEDKICEFTEHNNLVVNACDYCAKDISIKSKRNQEFTYTKMDFNNGETFESEPTTSLDLQCDPHDIIDLCNMTPKLNNGYFINPNFYAITALMHRHYENGSYKDCYYMFDGIKIADPEFDILTKVRGFEYQGEEISSINKEICLFVTDFDSPMYLLVDGKPQTYDVTFDACGGTFSSGETKVVLTQNTNEHFVLPGEDPTCQGSEFLGWYTEKEGGKQITLETYPWYPDDPEYTETAYAHWTTPVVPPDPGTDPGTEVINGIAQTGDSALYVGLCFMVLLASASVFVYRRNRATK